MSSENVIFHQNECLTKTHIEMYIIWLLAYCNYTQAIAQKREQIQSDCKKNIDILNSLEFCVRLLHYFILLLGVCIVSSNVVKVSGFAALL